MLGPERSEGGSFATAVGVVADSIPRKRRNSARACIRNSRLQLSRRLRGETRYHRHPRTFRRHSVATLPNLACLSPHRAKLLPMGCWLRSPSEALALSSSASATASQAKLTSVCAMLMIRRLPVPSRQLSSPDRLRSALLVQWRHAKSNRQCDLSCHVAVWGRLHAHNATGQPLVRYPRQGPP